MIEEGVKIHSKLSKKPIKTTSVFIVKLISHFVLAYLLVTVTMLLFSKICPTAQVLSIVPILLGTGRKLNVHKSYKRSF